MEKLKKFLFVNTNIRQTIVKNTFWITAGTMFNKIIRATVIIYAARILGAENYGIFTYAMSLVAIFAIFSDMGLTFTLTRDLTKYTEEKLNYLSTSLIIKLSLLAITILLVVILGPLISKFDQVKPLLTIIAFWIAFESLRNFFFAIIRSENNMQTEAGLTIITEIITTFLVIKMFFMNPSPASLALAYLLGSIIGLLITVTFLRKNIIGIFKYFKKKLVSPIIKSSLPFAVMGVFSIFLTNIDSIIIGIFGNINLLGLYGAAQRPINLLYTLPGFISTSIFPIINKLNKDNKQERLTFLVKKTFLLSIALALPIVIGGMIMAGPIINTTFGYQYIEATSTFQILLLTLLVVFPGSMISDVIFAENKQKVFLKSSLYGSITNIVLDLMLIPKYGIAGSAVATVIAQIVINGILFNEIKKNHAFKILKEIRKMIFAVSAMGILVFIMKIMSWPLIIIITLACIIYFGILFVLKEEIIEDMRAGFRV